METKETPSLITQFRSVHSLGLRVLKDYGKIVHLIRRRFLGGAKNCLAALYGIQAAVVQRYCRAIKDFRSITEEQYRALFLEFEHILNYLEFLSGQEAANSRSQPSVPPSGKNVFIIHGQDEVNTLRLQNLLQNHFGLAPVRMMGKAGKSRPLLEKFEDSASTCALAFALMTPDDEIVNQGDPYQQARPNVVFEAGWFVGRLGIRRVCLLLKEGTTVQSDIDGISRIQFKDDVEEKVLQIEKELEGVGFRKG